MLMKVSCSCGVVAETGDWSVRRRSGVRSAASVWVGCFNEAALALDARRSLKDLRGLLKDLERVLVISGEGAAVGVRFVSSFGILGWMSG